MDVVSLIGRKEKLFTEDINENDCFLKEEISGSSFLVVGGAGSIGQSVVFEIFRRNPKLLHVVDISENNLVELVRHVRSSLGYIEGEFKTFAIDCGSDIFDAFLKNQRNYDYILNLSALKHVRSEKDPYTLMRLVEVNVLNTIKNLRFLRSSGTGSPKKYFCVSTDKAANPVNMMGASKRIMEMFLIKEGGDIAISTARFANVAFSDGSLLHSFQNRLMKREPISAPDDVKRYFVTQQEGGELCLMSALTGKNRDIFFPKLSEKLNMMKFSDIAVKFLEANNYTPFLCETEDEARKRSDELIKNGKWPCFFFQSDTAGEKSYEEFYMKSEEVNIIRFKDIGIVRNEINIDRTLLDKFVLNMQKLKNNGIWTKEEILSEFFKLIPDFGHIEKNKYLDSKM